MQFALTKKVQDYFEIQKLSDYKESKFFLNDWVVNYTVYKRKRIFIFFNPQTKFVVIVTGLVKVLLFHDFMELLKKELLNAGLNKKHIENLPLMKDEFIFSKNTDRSASSTITKIISEIEYLHDIDVKLPSEINEKINCVLRKYGSNGEYRHPTEKLFDKLNVPPVFIKYESMKRKINRINF